MGIEIEQIQYLTMTEVAEEIQRSRMTLWRWVKAGHVPTGRRYRNLERLFTIQDLEMIKKYANRLSIVGDCSKEEGN